MRVERIGDATPVRIYALCEYPSWEPRYIGKTTQHLHERHKAHIRDAKRGSRRPVAYWMRKQLADGRRLAIRLIEFAGANWAERERHWIAAHRSPRLLNLTSGGEGLAGHTFSPEHRAKIAAALRTGQTFNCVCGSEFYRKASHIAKGQNKFCSRVCANIYNKGGTRVA
jgi:hypothetical protein